MKAIVCDLCGEKITGEYKEIFNSHTEGVARCTPFHNDVCNNCWNFLMDHRRIPLVEFPNEEVENGGK